MKINGLLLFLALILNSTACFAQREFSSTEGDTTYVMKRYVFMHLMAGSERSQDSTTAAELQKEHLAHLDKLAKDGKLVVAGPFQNGGDYRGLLIFDVETIDEALKLEGEDPAVKAKRLKMQAFYWWGAKGTKLP